jgi:hypothetical protein
MGIWTKPGGFIVTTPDKNFVHKRDIDQETLKAIADHLGIPKADGDKLMKEPIRSIFIYASDESKGKRKRKR